MEETLLIHKIKYLFPVLLLSAVLVVCRNGNTDVPAQENIVVSHSDTSVAAKFVRTNYIELGKIYSISKLRSSIGHDYWDDSEHCRSMKHYFQPKNTVDWSTIQLFSPVKGTVSRMFDEWAGTQVQIQSIEHPSFYFIIFHINLLHPLAVGDTLNEGQQLGTHIGPQTMSDIAVGNSTTSGWKLVSYFDVMTDSLFQKYQARGLVLRSDAIISKEARDADTLRCSGETFLNSGTLENWVLLN